jgi:hypothetical protein
VPTLCAVARTSSTVRRIVTSRMYWSAFGFEGTKQRTRLAAGPLYINAVC